MGKSREESLVYVQRPNQISHSLSIFDNPIKRRRRREDSSLAWYNLDKTKPVKEYRCTEFDDYIRKADSSKYFHPKDDLKHRRKAKAIAADFEFDVHEQDSSECDSLASNPEDSDTDEVSQPLVGVERKKSKLNGNIDQQDAIETSLFDVQVTVNANYRAEKVPFVCLTSQLNGQAILGYPVEIEELSDYEYLLPKTESGARKFHRLVWKTAKRTPVCYVTDLLSLSVSKNAGAEKDREIVEDSMMIPKYPKELNRRKEAKSGSCVPVELIFSKILAAVGRFES